MSLLSLPLEILQQIASCVETDYRPSLYAFSLVSKACNRASAGFVFREINITVGYHKDLRQDCERLVEAISRTGSQNHVLRINIKGALRLNAEQTESGEESWMVTSGTIEILPDAEKLDYDDPYVVYDQPVIEKSSEEDLAWTPVVKLLHTITRPKDLVYDCQSQFPPILLKTLHEQQPQCRLHHLTFRMRTLLWGVPYPYELELATSPCLYRVKLVCAKRDSDGDDDFNCEAMMELASGLAPNLKEVSVVTLRPRRSWSYRRLRDSWKGLPGYDANVKGSLTSLSLRGRFTVNDSIQNWSKHTDFACLQHLTLGDATDDTVASGETVEWLTQNLTFPKLTSLCLGITRGDSIHERPRYSTIVAAFFESLKPLQKLFVKGPIDSQIFNSIINRHGNTLRELTLHPSEGQVSLDHGRDRREIPMRFSQEHFMQIQTHCPVLEKLTITVRRTRSDMSEVAIYKCFSKMKSLRHLFLLLDCSNWRVFRDPTYDPDFSEGDQRLVEPTQPWKRGDIKECYINCAVDEALARSIWDIISRNKAGRRLESLKLWIVGFGEFGGNRLPSIDAVTNNLSRAWLLERLPREDREDIVVKELRKRARETRDANERLEPDSAQAQMFREIWPAREESDDWRDDWSSFPLQV